MTFFLLWGISSALWVNAQPSEESEESTESAPSFASPYRSLYLQHELLDEQGVDWQEPSLPDTSLINQGILLFNQDQWEEFHQKISQMEIVSPDLAHDVKMEFLASIDADPRMYDEIKKISPDVEPAVIQWKKDLEELQQKQGTEAKREKREALDDFYEEQDDRKSEADYERREIIREREGL